MYSDKKTKSTTLIYLITSVIAIILTNIFVSSYGMRGATISNVLITVILAILLSAIYIKEIYKNNVIVWEIIIRLHTSENKLLWCFRVTLFKKIIIKNLRR